LTVIIFNVEIFDCFWRLWIGGILAGFEGNFLRICYRKLFIKINRKSNNKFLNSSLNECYFAGKGTALMLGSNERLRTIDGRRVNQMPNELSSSQTSIGSVGSDIQQHLQSMFYLLRPEETLKMVSAFCQKN
jgi:hypothetical protein